MQLQKINPEDYAAIYAQMEENFILDERRDFEPAYELLMQGKFDVYHLLDGGKQVGFISLWHLTGFTYVEHFVIYEAYRNSGYGGKALSLVQQETERLVLEAEFPVDELTKRRIGFYQRNGFVQNDKPYLQPPYRAGGQEVEMVIMSYPTALANFNEVVKELQQIVYGKVG